MAKNKTYLAAPQDVRVVRSLGQLDAMSQFEKTRATFYDVQQYQFPLMPSEFDANFGRSIRLMSSIPNTPCPGRQTNLIGGLSVDVPFLVTRVSMIAFGETKKFTIPGQLVDRASVTGTCPDVGPCSAGQDAALYWGGAIDQFIINFFQAYRLQFAVGRYLLLDEALFDVGHLPPPCFDGASDSLVPAASYIREVNDVLAGKGCGKSFLPQTVAGSACIGAPTAGATYGCVTIGSKKPFCLNTPLLLLPGWPIDLELIPVEADCCFLPAMRRNAVLDCESAAPSFDAALAAGCGAYTVPGGCLSLGIELGGVILTPECCLQFAAAYGYGAMGQMFIGNPTMSGWINNQEVRQRALAGLPEKQAIDPNLNRFLGSPAVPVK